MGSLDIRDGDGGTQQSKPIDRNDSVRRFSRFVGGAIGLLATVFVILAENGVAPPLFAGIGKAIFWTGMVLAPLLIFNRDLLRFASSLMTILALFAVQAWLVSCAFSKLQYVDLFILAGICLVQTLVFFMPLMLIRKHKTGIWY